MAYYAHDVHWVDDLDNIVRKLKPSGSEGLTIKEALKDKFFELGKIKEGSVCEINECETPYFRLRFYKKGSLHIYFKDATLLNDLNILGAGIRKDLGYDDFGVKE